MSSYSNTSFAHASYSNSSISSSSTYSNSTYSSSSSSSSSSTFSHNGAAIGCDSYSVGFPRITPAPAPIQSSCLAVTESCHHDCPNETQKPGFFTKIITKVQEITHNH
ncbi:unnamed protein product [Caenorhabditis angaria]|uniref:Uncharacterized protein n=1 Tax=Caenorhabditis angaria TaxID=860376 RepID=A0A9P1IWD7_9PELO|nr:unnamed protein product [Caenorhabditis angaria]